MEKSETVQAMTDYQKNEIVETMIGAMPSLNFDQALAIIGNKRAFVHGIGAVFEPYLGVKPTTKPTDSVLPTEFKIGDRVYELVPFLKNGKSSVRGDSIIDRAKELDANLGEEDSAFILERQDKIPQEFRKFFLVFTAWRNHSNPQFIACLYWGGDRWDQDWSWIDRNWNKYDRLVRRRPATNPA